MKWYVYNDNEDGTYQLILDHNTTALVPWNSSGTNVAGMNEVKTALDSDISTWNSILGARLITADEVAKLVGIADVLAWSSQKPIGDSDLDHSSWFYLDGGFNLNPTTYSADDAWHKQYGSSTVKSNYYWLFDNTSDCLVNGCQKQDNNTYDSFDRTYNGVVYGYWTDTKTYARPGDAWYIRAAGYLSYRSISANDRCGVRPVITY